MQITQECDYAVRCILYLSERDGDVVMINEIAKAKKIPRSFLAKILQKLSKAGLVRSYRGVKGGFALTRRPSAITLLEVITAIEGECALNRCVINRRVCEFRKTCTVHPVWVDLSNMIERRLEKWTFKKLLEESKKYK
jgi:Rrf2 family protein